MPITYSDIKNIHTKCQLKRDMYIKDKLKLDGKIKRTQENLKVLEQAQVFLQTVSKETQEHLKFQIEDIVNLALDTCFPNEFTFSIEFIIKAGKTEAELVFTSQKTGRAIDPMNAVGGGVVDITAFALRIASYALDSTCDNVIILDEPMKFVSKDLLDRAGEILRTLSEKMNLQIIMVTHEQKFIDIADKLFTVVKNSEGVSVVKCSDKNF